MSDEIIPWHVDTTIHELQTEIESLREECQRLTDENTSLQNELGRQLDFIQRLMAELSKHGWGDFHYGNNTPQDPNIISLLKEGGYYNALGEHN